MKTSARSIWTIIAATLLLIASTSIALLASGAKVTYTYVVYTGYGPHTRQPHRSGVAANGFDTTTLAANDFSPGTDETTTPGTVSRNDMPNQLRGADGKLYNFAFVNVSGAASGGPTWFQNTANEQYIAGSSPITVLFVYVPTGGGGPSPNGVSIDAFDVTTGSLVSDTFVSVSPDRGGPPPPLTTSGNVDGWVSTAHSAERITAYKHIAPTNADFLRWHYVVYEKPPARAGVTFAAAKDANASILAFYKASGSKATPQPSITPRCPPGSAVIASLQKAEAAPPSSGQLPIDDQKTMLNQAVACLVKGAYTTTEFGAVTSAINNYFNNQKQGTGPHATRRP
jgi:hypothetical protein